MSNLKAHLFDLADRDREALAVIREKLELDSNALAVRLSIRALARRLSDPAQLGENREIPTAGTVGQGRTQTPDEGGGIH